MTGLTRDAFLGGRLQIWQPESGYRAGIDPVLLAAAAPVRTGQSVLELGCGVGVAMLCIGRRVEGASLHGVELQPEYAELAARNAKENGIVAAVHCADLADMPLAVRSVSFDHVIANPPYFSRARGSAAEDPGRDVALAGETPLADWVRAAARRLKPKGAATFIQRAERLPELLGAANRHLGSLTLLPISPREGRPPKLALLRATKGGRAAFRMLPPLILHEGEKHHRDGEDYARQVRRILREGEPLDF